MRVPVFPLIIMAIICMAIDFYILMAAVKRCKSKVPARIQMFSELILYVFFIGVLCLPRESGSDDMLLTVMWSLFVVISIYAAKFVFVFFDLIASIPMLFKKPRLSWLSVTGGCLALITFLAMWWGALVNRFRVQVNEVEIVVPDLPDSFDGFRIVQISDLHTGTYGADTTFISKLVDQVNALNGDMIVFTGDIVNRHGSEVVPHLEPLSRLDADFGVYSILGNHDYGDYSTWESEAAKQADVDALVAAQRSIGWDVLLNEHRIIHCGPDSIALIGVENVGDPPFKIYGSLADSYPNLSDPLTKILRTHNPAHWNQEIENNDSAKVALTLSGHTHAMQMEILGYSPAVFRYSNWGGLYHDAKGKHPLYVNIGTGTVGLPMRLGATPEITVLKLKKH